MKKLFLALLLMPQLLYAIAFTDPLNLIENAATAKASIDSLIKQGEMLQAQLEDLKNFKHMKPTELLALSNQLKRLNRDGRALTHRAQHIEKTFQQQFPNYQQASERQSVKKTQRQQQKTTLDTLQYTYQAQHEINKQLEQEQQQLKAAENSIANSAGNLQALQSLSSINSQQVQQLNSIKQVMLTQNDAVNAYMANQLSRQAFEDEMLSEVVDNLPDTPKPYQENPKLGKIQ